MPKQKKKPTPDNSESQNYTAVALPFFVTGIALFASEGTRAVGLPFLVLGLAFFAIGSQGYKKKPKK